MDAMDTTPLPKRGRGRPRREVPQVSISFRFSPAELDAIRAAAELDNRPIAQWVRDRLARIAAAELARPGR